MKNISKLQLFRWIVQIVSLFLLPGLFSLSLYQLNQTYIKIVSGSFVFADHFPMVIESTVIVIVTILLGRFFCGWFCAFGTLNDLLYLFSSKVLKIKLKVSRKVDTILKFAKYFVLAFIIIVIWSFGSKLFQAASPWDAFGQITQLPMSFFDYPIGFVLLAAIMIGAMLVERFFCRYLCPLGAIFTIISLPRFIKIGKPTNDCGQCSRCTNKCAMGISLNRSDKVSSGECINCFKCVTACARNNTKVMVGKKILNPAISIVFALILAIGLLSVSSLIVLLLGKSPTLSTSVSAVTDIQNNGTATDKYKDGTYTGVGRGYRPNLAVLVTVKNDKITAIEIGSNYETPSYASMPFSTVPKQIIATQSTAVDAVSGATRTSNGIMEAVQSALNQAATANSSASSDTSTVSDNAAPAQNTTVAAQSASASQSSAAKQNTTSSNRGTTTKQTATVAPQSTSAAQSTVSSQSTTTTPSTITTQSSTTSQSTATAATPSTATSTSSSTVTTTGKYKDGTYTGVGRGYRPNLSVSVTVKSDKITAIEIGSNYETPRYTTVPFSTIPAQIIATQSTTVDTVSGATRTSNGIMEAVKNALLQAAAAN